MRKPIKLAIAQIEEHTPPKSFVEKLERETQSIKKVIVLPLAGSEMNYHNNIKETDISLFEARMRKVRRLSVDLGADYILLFGGSTDISARQGWLGFWI